MNPRTPFDVPALAGPVPWTALDTVPERPEEFTFSLLSDRTGFARVGVFERAIEVTNLVRPDFTLHVGDAIEGYTEDAAEIDEQWEQVDAMFAELEAPLFRTPGNHDVSNPTMRAEWLRRYGALHYSFRYRDVLFLVVDTQDPPKPLGDIDPQQLRDRLAQAAALAQDEPAKWFASQREHITGPMPVSFTEEQLTWFEQTAAANADVRWTFVIMHMPVWQDRADIGYRRMRAALGDRSFTMFSGHCHNYKREVIDGRAHIRLGASGGVWTTDDEDGGFDHVTLVSMTPSGPRIANLMLDGVLGAEGGVYAPRPFLAEPMRLEVSRLRV